MMRTRALALGFLVVSVLALPVVAARPALARVSAVGLIDYTKKNFKVGDWVRYRIEIENSRGMEDVKLQEVRIVGEETYRGERCFWVETWYGPEEKAASYDLSLMSYDVFKDVAPDVHYKHYVRLVMAGVDDQGVPEMNDLARSNPEAPLPDLRPLRGTRDTLGVETLETPRGPIEAEVLRLKRRIARTYPNPDSTLNNITETSRKTWFSRTVPLTSVVREEEVTDKKIQVYAVGQPSTTAPETVVETVLSRANLVDWGSGAKSDLLQQWRNNRGLLRPRANAVMEDDPNPPR
jgi:hypothetical protein